MDNKKLNVRKCDDGHYQIVNNDTIAVEMFLNESLYPDTACINRLKMIASLPSVIKPFIALPDLYLKEKNFIPTGLTLLLKDMISPMLISPPNDGFLLGKTNLFESDLNNIKLDLIFNSLVSSIGKFRRSEPEISEKKLFNILINGVTDVYKEWGFNSTDVESMESNGSAFGRDSVIKNQQISEAFKYSEQKSDRLPDFVPWRNFIDAGRHCLGVLDGSSHFLECNVVEDIISEELASYLNLKKGQVLFSIHNGAADIGLFSHFLYLSDNKNSIQLLDTNKKEGKMFLTAYKAAANFGYANRLYIFSKIRNALLKAFDNSVKCSVLSDVPHDMLEEIDYNNETVYMHRKGSSRALPSSFFSKNSPFSKTGRPFYFPSSIGGESYIMTNRNGNQSTYFTCSHGTGRKMKLDDAKNMFNSKDVVDEVKKKMRLYRLGDSSFSGNSPDAYKNMGDVINMLRSFDLAESIVRLRPIATLKI